jgi:hypothetical protein
MTADRSVKVQGRRSPAMTARKNDMAAVTAALRQWPLANETRVNSAMMSDTAMANLNCDGLRAG